MLRPCGHTILLFVRTHTILIFRLTKLGDKVNIALYAWCVCIIQRYDTLYVSWRAYTKYSRCGFKMFFFNVLVCVCIQSHSSHAELIYTSGNGPDGQVVSIKFFHIFHINGMRNGHLSDVHFIASQWAFPSMNIWKKKGKWSRCSWELDSL